MQQRGPTRVTSQARLPSKPVSSHRVLTGPLLPQTSSVPMSHGPTQRQGSGRAISGTNGSSARRTRTASQDGRAGEGAGSALVAPPAKRASWRARTRIRIGQQRAHRQQHLRDGQGRAPLALQDVKANAPVVVDVAMVNPRRELDLRGRDTLREAPGAAAGRGRGDPCGR
eukprot:scaffold39283_cov63-Phaeocystis_antarctica.AAC.4